MSPTQAIKVELTGLRALTARTITDMLVVTDYRWPLKRGRSCRPSPHLVYNALRAMERRGEVERVPCTEPIKWRLPR